MTPFGIFEITPLGIVYAIIGGLLLKTFLRLARERATLGLT